MIRPFLVLGLPRSRTTWLARFLTYREWWCGHEEARHIRGVEDAKSWFAQPFTGSAETAVAPFWRLIQRIAPETRVVLIRRSPDEVVASLLKLDLMGGAFEPAALKTVIARTDAKLDQIRERWPRALDVSFSELENEDVCASIFEFCLPYDHDRAWWATVSKFNLQDHVPALMRYSQAFRPQMERTRQIAKQKMLSDLSLKRKSRSGEIEIATESFETFYRDGQALFAEHEAVVGEAPQSFADKNLPMLDFLDKGSALQVLTARSNGKMFGYLLTEISPSREDANRLCGTHTTFFASRQFPGLGLKLQREAVKRLRRRGVTEVWGVAGSRGDGPRMSAVYRRLGFESAGSLHRLNMEER